MGVAGSGGRLGQRGRSGCSHRGARMSVVRGAFQRRMVARENDSALQTFGGLQRMIELAFGAAHAEWLNSIVGEPLGGSTGAGGVLPKQLLAFRKSATGYRANQRATACRMDCSLGLLSVAQAIIPSGRISAAV